MALSDRIAAAGRRVRTLILALVTVAATTAFGPLDSLFAPSADLWPRWTRHDDGNPARIDFADWDAFLGRFVAAGADGVNRVRYGAVGAAERDALDAVVARLAAVPVSSHRRDEQLAYWINLYNALTVAVVVDHYPVDSIRDIDISPGLFADGPWDAELVRVEGEALSLNDIEHRILRPIWRDPRIHYAVNCAALGCPNLASEAYEGATIRPALERAARAYVNDPRGVSIAGGRLVVSSIYAWFVEDFGGDEDGVLVHLAAHAEAPLAARLREAGGIDETRYDWSLNDAGSGR